MVESIVNADSIEFEGVIFTDFKLKVVVPKNLKGNIRQKGDLFYKRHGFNENTLRTKYRKHHT